MKSVHDTWCDRHDDHPAHPMTDDGSRQCLGIPWPGQPLWSILIATLDARQDKFVSLAHHLAEQIAEWDHARTIDGQLASGLVEIVVLRNNGEDEIGVYRQRLLDAAFGRWVSFVDDDDLVADSFVMTLAAALAVHGPQVIGFPMWYTTGTVLGGLPVNHEADLSLRYDGWDKDGYGTITCDLTHIQPIRADLARLGRFDTGAFPEDRAWRAQVRPHLDLAGEHYIAGEHLYYYRHDRADSAQTDVRRLAAPLSPPDLGRAGACVRWVNL